MVKTSPFFRRGLFEKTLLELMISGYHYFPKHPCGNIIQFLCVFFPSESGNVKVQFKDDFYSGWIICWLVRCLSRKLGSGQVSNISMGWFWLDGSGK